MTAKKQTYTHTKEQYLRAVKYAERRDIIHAVMEDGERISPDELERRIKELYERSVN